MTINCLQSVCLCVRVSVGESVVKKIKENESIRLFAMLPVVLARRVSLINLHVDNVLNYFIL